MVESDEDSGPPSVAEHEPGPTTSPFLISCHPRHHDALPPRSLFMFIIGICSFPFMFMTVSRPRLHLVFSAPLIHPPHRPRMVQPSVHTLTFRVSIHGQNDRPSLIVPYFPLLSLDRSLPLSTLGSTSHRVSPSLFFFRRVVLSLSQPHGNVSTSCPLAHTAVKYYIFNIKHSYPPTSDLRIDPSSASHHRSHPARLTANHDGDHDDASPSLS